MKKKPFLFLSQRHFKIKRFAFRFKGQSHSEYLVYFSCYSLLYMFNKLFGLDAVFKSRKLQIQMTTDHDSHIVVSFK